MHEYSITSSIIEILEDIGKKNKLDKIKKVNFTVSPVASIEPESIRFYYQYLSKDNNLLKGAELVFEKSKLNVKCLSCNKEFTCKEFQPICPGCGSSNVLVQETDEIKIMSVET
jgi:hydrogenase nickel incorporation protein HypA/HybF